MLLKSDVNFTILRLQGVAHQEILSRNSLIRTKFKDKRNRQLLACGVSQQVNNPIGPTKKAIGLQNVHLFIKKDFSLFS